jgi:hypothetical protein
MPFKSIYGQKVGQNDDGSLLGVDGVATGGNGKPLVRAPSSDHASMFDDFFPVNIAADTANVGTYFNYREGTDTGWTGLVSATLPHGVAIIKPDAVVLAGSAAPTHAAGIVGKAIWKAGSGPGNTGNLRLVARVMLPTVSRTSPNRQSAFIGFTDNTAFEMPIYDTGAGAISAAADAVGFVLGARTDTGWNGYAVKSTAGDSGDQQVVLGKAPTSGRWTTLEIEVIRNTGDTGGRANFYVDGELRGSINSPVATDTPLAPAVYAMLEDTGLSGTAGGIQVDFVGVSVTRDSGD